MAYGAVSSGKPPTPATAAARNGRAHENFKRLVATAQRLAAVTTAIACPRDEASLKGAVEAAHRRLIVPILVGPNVRIREVAERSSLDIGAFEIVDVAHSRDAAAKAVEVVRSGRAEALMKGSLHTDEFMAAAVSREAGLRTARHISHCFIMDVPGLPGAVIITDAAVNVAPSLEEKVDIVQNAIDLAHVMGVSEVRVAILSAMDTVTSKVPSTIEAAALCKMADRGQITRALIDGPLTLENALSAEAVGVKKTASQVAGKANVLVVPDLEAGNMLANSLSILAGAEGAGIVVGARVPIILAGRADALLTRLASCAVAVLIAAARRTSTAIS